jgi:predicted transcriptional regulator
VKTTEVGGRSRQSTETAVSMESPSFHEVLATLFDLNERDVETFRTIQEQPGATTEDIETAVGRDRSNVNRSITQLEELGLVVRKRRVMEAGGFFYEHHPEPAETVERRLVDAVESWADDAVTAIGDHEWAHAPDPLAGTPARE